MPEKCTACALHECGGGCPLFFAPYSPEEAFDDCPTRIVASVFNPSTPIFWHLPLPVAAGDPRNYRLHLRLEADGNGVLLVNTSTCCI